MKNYEFNAAIPLFRKVSASSREFYSPDNNLALCLFATGRLDEAIKVQNESIEHTLLPNPFGLCNLSTFHYIKGDEIRSRRFLDMAIETEMPSEDACVKVCEVLARFQLHQKILDFVNTTEYENDPNVSFYTGIAAANLDDRKRARADLERVPLGYHKAAMARRYLDHLRDNTTPHTVSGDWPYLLLYEICPRGMIVNSCESEINDWMSRPVMVDVCEAMLNDSVEEVKSVTGILSGLKHPDATKLLWKIVKGSYGPDKLRMEALNILKMNGDIGKMENVEVLLDGEKRKINVVCTCLNSEFRFGEELPPKLNKKYIRAIKSMQKKNPDWEAAEKKLLAVINEVPDFYPAKYNYAITLLKRGLMDIAEPVIREIVENFPEYLFARSTLLQILLADNRVDEAEELITSLPGIEETHSDAMAVWMTGQSIYYEHLEDYEKAADYSQQAYDLAPHLPAVQRLWESYQ
ncbi:MAG: hypothetical protein PF904_03025 [Kiritimatiellae bacterium]|nr:hypothetical protein [Kiritimatiellia bacterium]